LGHASGLAAASATGAKVVKHFSALIVAAMLVGSSATLAAEIRVDISAPFKPVDHAASGSLYGIAADGWPADKWIAGVHPKNFTQMAPGGGQKPNGEPAPVGDALIVAPVAARQGATVTIRMPDMFPSFPYIWQGEDFWFRSVDAIARATVASHAPNIYAYEIWNEEDWNWQPQWGDFDDIWARTHKAIRAIDPERRITARVLPAGTRAGYAASSNMQLPPAPSPTSSPGMNSTRARPMTSASMLRLTGRWRRNSASARFRSASTSTEPPEILPFPGR